MMDPKSRQNPTPSPFMQHPGMNAFMLDRMYGMPSSWMGPMPGLPMMPTRMPMSANDGVSPWIQAGPFAHGPAPWQQLPLEIDMKKFRQIRHARAQAWRDWMLSLGLANVDLDETNEEGDESGEDKSNGIPESKRASKTCLNPQQDWYNHMQRMRMLGPTVSWLDEEVPDLVFENSRYSYKAPDRGGRVKTAGEDRKSCVRLTGETEPRI